MSKFKVGDWVTGNEYNYYGITNENMTIGEVIEVDYYGDIDVRVIEHKEKRYIGIDYNGLNPEKFNLIED